MSCCYMKRCDASQHFLGSWSDHILKSSGLTVSDFNTKQNISPGVGMKSVLHSCISETSDYAQGLYVVTDMYPFHRQARKVGVLSFSVSYDVQVLFSLISGLWASSLLPSSPLLRLVSSWPEKSWFPPSCMASS